MNKIIRILIPVILLTIIAVISLQKCQETKNAQQISLQLNQLRGVAKLVLWEQTFTLNNTESISRKYFGLIKSEESIHSTIEGKMGFHIDLADSINTHFDRINDTIYITAPLRNTYIELDLSTLTQVKESSLDPSLEIKKEEVVKNLQQKAIAEYLPTIKDQISAKDIQYQESKLSQMTGVPVKISITSFPDASGFHWKGDR